MLIETGSDVATAGVASGRLANGAIVLGLTVALASLDIVESILAMEWSIRRSPWLLIAGLTASIGLFVIFVAAIRFTEMSTVTLGWIVLMQAGLMTAERVRYGVDHPPGKWVAVAVMVLLQGYLVVTPSPTRT
jgi:hypothetical protein